MGRRFAALPLVALALAALALVAVAAAAKAPKRIEVGGCTKQASRKGLCDGRAIAYVESEDPADRFGIESVLSFCNDYGAPIEIQFAPDVRGKIVLAHPLVIKGDISILGPGPDALRLSGDGKHRILEVEKGAQADLAGLSLSDGRDVGKAGKGFEEPGGAGIGGAILNRGTTILERVTLSGNTALGGASEGNAGGPGRGGAIANYGKLLILKEATFADNSAIGSAEHRSDLASNKMSGGEAVGGAIANEGSLSLAASEFVGNKAVGGHGERIVFIGVAVSDAGSAYGGAIYNGPAAEPLRITDSTFAGNLAEGGFVPQGSKLGDAGGGAIFSSGPGLLLERSSVTRNSVAVRPGPETLPHPFGAGLASVGAPGLLRSDTVVFDSGAADLDSAQPAPVVNTILGGCSGAAPASRGFNLDYGTSCRLAGPNDISSTNADLGGLENHGGPTRTLAPFPDSPVVDRGVSTEDQDQRGEKRPVAFPSLPHPPGGDGADIGSVELQRLAVVTVAPEVLAFGDQRVETISKPAEIVLTNVSAGPFQVGAATIDGDAIDDFSISSQTCANSDLAGGGSCRIRIRFQPSDAGPRTAKLRIASTARGGIPPIALDGKGTAPSAGRRRH